MNSEKTTHHSMDGQPLAERMRPRNLAEFAGQRHLLDRSGMIAAAVAKDLVFSMIFWGPPGVGKTTLARIIARETRSRFIHFSAVLAGVKDIRAVIDQAEANAAQGYRTILFVDEIHRFNKAQQDAFLPHVESGKIILIGATTENPSFEVIPALMSRCTLLVLHRLTQADIESVLRKALEDTERGLGRQGLCFADNAIAAIADMADGDARCALNLLETVSATLPSGVGSPDHPVAVSDLKGMVQKKLLHYDKSGEEHYNLISALHKSLRGSDPDAAIYWLERMLSAGEDPFYIARRMVRFASEDVGIADPFALDVAMNAMEAFRFLGHPEGDLALVQAAVYLATAPKSNKLYEAHGRVKDAVKKHGALPVPHHIRNPVTKLMAGLGYGKDYRYAHDYPDAWTPQEYLPEDLIGQRFYTPSNRGYERQVKDRLEKWIELKRARRNKE
jgi:putative ATPase